MSLMSIGLSGLNAAQTSLNAASNNLANLYTVGHSREIANLANNPAGGGVKVTSVERQFNLFVATQANDAKSTLAGLNKYQTQISQIDSLLADSDSGLSVMMQGFFSSLQDLSSAPSDPAARQGVIGSADNLAAQFRSMDNYLRDLKSSANSEIGTQITQVNNIATQIADLNKQISLTKAKTGEAPNALLDQRDQLVSQLGERVNIKLSVQDSGTYNISFASGLSLVAGFTSSKLEATVSSANPTLAAVGYRDDAGNLIEIRDKNITGGELGGILQFRNEALTSTENRLGQLAVGVALSFNKQHALGVDLNGAAGTDFFSIGQPKVFNNQNNAGTASLTGTFVDASQLSADDYNITYSSVTGFTVTNKTTGATAGTYSVGTTNFTVGGMEFSVGGAPADGDRFQVKPFENATSGLANNITDVDKIAAGLPAGGTGSGDNRNALALLNLQTAKVLNGQSTLNQGYAALVTDVGNRSQVVNVKQETQQNLAEQLDAVQQSISGVNMTEEGANLLRFQQHYQASAKVINTATTVMDTILGLKG